MSQNESNRDWFAPPSGQPSQSEDTVPHPAVPAHDDGRPAYGQPPQEQGPTQPHHQVHDQGPTQPHHQPYHQAQDQGPTQPHYQPQHGSPTQPHPRPAPPGRPPRRPQPDQPGQAAQPGHPAQPPHQPQHPQPGQPAQAPYRPQHGQATQHRQATQPTQPLQQPRFDQGPRFDQQPPQGGGQAARRPVPRRQQPRTDPFAPRRGAQPDQQVWPPAGQPGFRNGSTQPIPVVPAAGPMSPPSGGQPGQGGEHPGRSAHGMVAPASPAQDEPETASSATPPPPSDGAAEGQAAPPPRRPRTVMLGVSAIVALLVGIGAPTVDAYLFYRSGQPADIEHVVDAGKEMTFEHVAWKARIETMDPPQTTAPDRQWLKITITRKGVDETGIRLTAKPELELRDRTDRTWQVQVAEDNVALDEDAEVGKAYTYTAVAVVPKAVAGQVELRLRPNTTYRSDTPTDKLFAVPTDPAQQEKAKHKDVLVFRR